jgi:hypothetical protein
MSFGIYAVGYLILIAGVAYFAHLMHIPDPLHCGDWIHHAGDWGGYRCADYPT